MSGPPPRDNVSIYVPRIGEDEIPKHWMNFGAAERLGVFTHYRFFTPALLYIYGRLWDEPLCQFLSEYQGECHFMHHKFDKPIFAGMEARNGNPEWNHVLWAVEIKAFEPLERFLLSLAFVDPETSQVTRFGSQDIVVVDPLAMARQTLWVPDLPLLDIVAFGVNASWGAVALSQLPVPQLPRVHFHLPQATARQFAQALAKGENPNDALVVQQFPPLTLPPAQMPMKELNQLTPEHQQKLLHEIEQYKRDHPERNAT